jgi:hypothetical protein
VPWGCEELLTVSLVSLESTPSGGCPLQQPLTGELIMTNKLTLGLSALCMVVSAVYSTSAQSAANVGILSCTVEGGIGLILGSSKDMTCKFDPADGSEVQRYSGRVGKLGLDIGVTNESYITWQVIASGKLKPGSLEGSYGGASAQATAGVGLGANVLVGGSDKSITLQPVSVQGQTGLNVALGIGTMKLNFVE